MKELQLVVIIDDLKLEDKDAEKKPQELSFSIIQGIVFGYASEQKGLAEEERRVYYKLCDAIEDAINNDQSSVSLEDEWAKFLQDCKSKSRFLPNKLSQRVEKLIDEMSELKTK